MTVETPHQSRFFSQEDIDNIKIESIPKHIAIIPDGNRRWAKENKLKSILGHRKGCDILFDIVEGARDLGVETLTMYAFSTENWQRPQYEVNALMGLLKDYVIQHRTLMIEKGVKLETIGDLSAIPEEVQNEFSVTKEATKNCSHINLVLAINYGGRDELCRCFNRLMQDRTDSSNPITMDEIASNLDTAPWGDPQLLIRTSGELRISNFLLWQLSYAELYCSEKYWPEFIPSDLFQAIQHYQKRQRRLGR